jgi:hypothetical protein
MEKLTPLVPVITVNDAEKFWHKDIDQELEEFYSHNNLSIALSRRFRKSDTQVMFHEGQNIQEILIDLQRIGWKIIFQTDNTPEYVTEMLLEESISSGYYIIETEENGLNSKLFRPCSPALALETILLGKFMVSESLASIHEYSFLWKTWIVTISIPNFSEKNVTLKIWHKDNAPISQTIYVMNESP